MVVDVVVIRFPDNMGRDRWPTAQSRNFHPSFFFPEGREVRLVLGLYVEAVVQVNFNAKMVIARLSAKKERHHSTILVEKHSVG